MPLPEPPVALSAVSLRLVGEIGQVVLDQVAAGDLATAAELDQHIAAVRASLTARRLPLAAATHVASVAGLADGRLGQAARAAATSHPAGSGEPVADRLTAASPAAPDTDGVATDPVPADPVPADPVPADPVPADPVATDALAAESVTSGPAGPTAGKTVADSAAADGVPSISGQSVADGAVADGAVADGAVAEGAQARRRGAAAARRRARQNAEPRCPDVPFTATAWRSETAVPLRLLLHYACGFIEAAVIADWWPGQIEGEGFDYESMRLAAVCQLISQAEVAAEMHPDLR